jgi:hypothetical protein
VHTTPDVETTESILDYDYKDPYKQDNRLYILGSRTTTTPGRTEIVSVPEYGPSFVVRRLVTSHYRCTKCNLRKTDLHGLYRGAYFDTHVGVVRLPYLQEPCTHGRKVDRLAACQAAWYAAWRADHPRKSLKPDQIRICFEVTQGGQPAQLDAYTSQEALQALTKKGFMASFVLSNLSSEAKKSLPVMLVFAHFHPDLHDLLPEWTRTNATVQRAMQQIV